MVNLPTRIPDGDSQSPALLDLFISFDASNAFSSMANFDHVFSGSIDFTLNSKENAPFIA